MARAGRIRKQKVTLVERWARDGLITPERARQVGEHVVERVIADGTASNVTVLEIRDDPIDKLWKRNLITAMEREAAEKFRENYERSGLDALKAQDWTRPLVDQSGHKGAPEFRQEALDRHNHAILAIEALDKVSGLLKRMFLDVVLRKVPLVEADTFIKRGNERDQKASNLALLRLCLQGLMAHYGMKKGA